MARPVLRRAARAAYAVRERLLLPEARAGREQWQRVMLRRAVDERLAALPVGELRAAEISGADHAGRGWARFESLDYPAFDLCAEPDEARRGAYDVVFCEQVLEHVPDPWVAARTLRTLLAPRGLAVVSTPFLIREHELPAYGMPDFWRFTPRGLRTLLEAGGFGVERVDHWGNRWAVAGNLDHWAAYRRWMPLVNERGIAVQVWAFARAPG